MGIGALHLLRSAPYYLKRVIALLEKKVMNWEKSANYFFISVGLKQKVRRLGQHEKYFTTHLLLTKQQSREALEDWLVAGYDSCEGAEKARYEDMLA